MAHDMGHIIWYDSFVVSDFAPILLVYTVLLF